ncbi:hypothetical protein EV175_000914 [Coemansia sp. RSA 1933]|nr:hypothetical protein EV175_000914 [Coemansia sp. RSA 1933]
MLTPQQAFKAELARYEARREAIDDMPEYVRHSFDAVLTTGYALYSTWFKEAGSTVGSRTTQVGRLDAQIASLDAEIDDATADIASCRTVYNREAAKDSDHRNSVETLRYLKEQYKQLKEERQQLEDRRQELEDNQQAAFTQAKAAFDEACTRFAMSSKPLSASGRGIFSQLAFNDDSDSSSHKTKTTRFVYKFIREPTLLDAVSRFQDECLGNSTVSKFVAKDTSQMQDRKEDDFADHVIADFAPRLCTILQGVVGLGRIEIRKLAKNNGVDLEVLAYLPHGRDPFVSLPIEVKRSMKGYSSTYDPSKENLRTNVATLRKMAGSVGGRSVTNLNRALSQTTTYIERLVYSQNRGVLLGKDCVVLLQRTNRNSVFVSDVIDYRSVRPHPVAAVAFWIREALFNPSQTIVLEECGHIAELASETSDHRDHSYSRSDSTDGNIGSSSHRTQYNLRQRTQDSQAAGSDTRRIGQSAPGGGAPTAGNRRHADDTVESAASHGSHHSSITASDVADVDPLDKTVDTSGVRLKFVKWSRCGKIYSGQWRDGQQVIVKATPANDRELMDELRAEIRAYSRLRDLQGSIVPLIITYGYADIDGQSSGILVVEKIQGENILSAVRMDKRSALTRLSNAERVTCLNALGKIHRRGVSPNDIRGANLLFRPRKSGEKLCPVFIDFGFAMLDTGNKFKQAKEYDYLRMLDVFKGTVFYA